MVALWMMMYGRPMVVYGRSQVLRHELRRAGERRRGRGRVVVDMPMPPG
jgi:hypothetical protein